jgi:hypothetical protein
MGASESDTASVRSASCPRDIAELFNDYFTSVLNSNDDLIDSTTLPSTTQCERTTSELNLSPEDVFVCLRTLDVNKATGPDGILPRLLKETAHQIAPSLSTLFNRSLDSGYIYQKNGNWLTSYQFSRKVTNPSLRTVVPYRSFALYRKSSSVACWTSCAITCYNY